MSFKIKSKKKYNGGLATPGMRREVAIHECGHTVVARLLGVRVEEVNLKRRKREFNGQVHIQDGACLSVYGSEWTKDNMALWCEYAIKEQMAGGLAQLRHQGRGYDEILDISGSERDTQHIFGMFALWNGVREKEQQPPLDMNTTLNRLATETARLIEEYWVTIEVMAKVLLKKRVLSGDEIDAVIMAQNPGLNLVCISDADNNKCDRPAMLLELDIQGNATVKQWGCEKGKRYE